MSFLQEIRQIKSGKKELREFGMVLGTFFALLAALSVWRIKNFLPFLFLSLFFTFFGLFIPVVLKPIQKGWMTLALLMGFVMTRVILIVLFYFVLTPLGLVARLFGHVYLDLAFRKNRGTYWIPRPEKTEDKGRYEVQF